MLYACSHCLSYGAVKFGVMACYRKGKFWGSMNTSAPPSKVHNNVKQGLRRNGRHDVQPSLWMSIVSLNHERTAITTHFYILWETQRWVCCIAALWRSHGHTTKAHCQRLRCRLLVSTNVSPNRKFSGSAHVTTTLHLSAQNGVNDGIMGNISTKYESVWVLDL